jgi:hypothetical protein
MAKKPKLYAWRILDTAEDPPIDRGRVYAPNADAAIREAIQQFQITTRGRQMRLVAWRRGEDAFGALNGPYAPVHRPQ